MEKIEYLVKYGLKMIYKQLLNTVMVIGLDIWHSSHMYRKQVDKMIGHSCQDWQIKITWHMGLYDGTLATWYAKGFYRLSNINVGADNSDINMNYPDDIKGG